MSGFSDEAREPASFRRSGAVLLVWLFLVSYALFGVRATMMEDDYGFCYARERFTASEILYRNWISTGITRFGSHFLERWALPQLRDEYWLVHLFDVSMLGLNTFLVFLLFRRFTGMFGLSFAIAGLFCLWPLKNEAVFWGVQFNLQIGMSLLLSAGLMWLRSEPGRPGWWRRAWPVPVLMFLSGQFSEQAFTAGAALPALTLFTPPASAWALLRRFVAQSAYVCVSVLVFGVVFLATVRHENLPTGASQRHSVTGAGELPYKVFHVVRHFTGFYPMSRYDRITLRDGLLQFPEIASENPWLWCAPAITIALLARWAAFRLPPISTFAIPPGVWPGLLLFGALEWLYALVPVVASREYWVSFRLGFVPGLGQHVFLASAATWSAYALARRLRPFATRPESAVGLPAGSEAGGRKSRLETAARTAFGALLAVYAFVNLADGRQYFRQFQADTAQANYLKRVLPENPEPMQPLLVGNVPIHAQPYGARNADHIVNAWSMPWAARAMLGKHFPQPIAFHVHPYAANGDRPVVGEEVYLHRNRYFAFLLPEWTADFRPEESELIPVLSIRFRDLQGRTLTAELPAMRTVPARSRWKPVEIFQLDVRDIDEMVRLKAARAGSERR